MRVSDDMTLRKRLEGFTLIEVMIALAIFAIAMSALMSAMNNNTRNLASLQNRTLAHWIASNRLVGFQITKSYPKQKEEIEKITYGGTDKPREWVIRIQVKDTGNKDFKMLQISAGEEINKQPQYYATVETVYAVGK